MAAPDPAADRTGLWVVVIVIGTLVTWAAAANLLGGVDGFGAALLIAAVASSVVWRDRLSYEALSNIGLVGVPVVVLALSLS